MLLISLHATKYAHEIWEKSCQLYFLIERVGWGKLAWPFSTHPAWAQTAVWVVKATAQQFTYGIGHWVELLEQSIAFFNYYYLKSTEKRGNGRDRAMKKPWRLFPQRRNPADPKKEYLMTQLEDIGCQVGSSLQEERPHLWRLHAKGVDAAA